MIKPRYQHITLEMIKSIRTEEVAEQPYNLLKEEFTTLDPSAELTGGRVSKVYKINDAGAVRVLKVSLGLYRMTELSREAEAIQAIAKDGLEYLVPKVFAYRSLTDYAYLLEEYIEGETAREKLRTCTSADERAQLWNGLGHALSEIHKHYMQTASDNNWINEQLALARMNMDHHLLDMEEFEKEAPGEMLQWLHLNKPEVKQLSLMHGDYRPKNILMDASRNYKVIDWGFVDRGDPYYDLAIIDYYFKSSEDRGHFYEGYKANHYDKGLIEYYDKLSKFINV